MEDKMTDYISRKAAVELFQNAQFEYTAEEAAEFASRIPAADVVEVVRCVNCKYWNPRYNKSYKGHFCEVTTEFVTEHDYCSFGLRWREDNG